MMHVVHTKRFRRDYTKLKRSGKNIEKLEKVMEMLMDGKQLPARHRDHALQGEAKHMRDCHIEGDWLLLYETGWNSEKQETIIFHATGTHENLFG